MAWVRYRRLQGHPGGVFRARDVVFDLSVHDGLAEVTDEATLVRLTQTCGDCGALVHFHVTAPPAEATPPAPVLEDDAVEPPKRRGRPPKAT